MTIWYECILNNVGTYFATGNVTYTFIDELHCFTAVRWNDDKYELCLFSTIPHSDLTCKMHHLIRGPAGNKSS